MHLGRRHAHDRSIGSMLLAFLSVVLVVPLSGCSTGGFFGADGPSTGRVLKTGAEGSYGAVLIDVTSKTAIQVSDAVRTASFADALGEGAPFGTLIGAGDTLRVAIYEAPPAVLFNAGQLDSVGAMSSAPQRPSALPDIPVSDDGTIDIPFAGRIRAAGRTPAEVARDITARLAGKAHSPQVLVNIGENGASTVTVVGEVVKSTRMPLTARGERLLDALAAGGGTREAIDKVSVRLTRGDAVIGMPLQSVIRDPRQNIYLRPGDIITAYFQSQSFTILGAAGKNAEVNFEAQGITLAQALGRIGGIRDERANPRGVFIFRLEDPAALDQAALQSVTRTREGKVPVIYRIDLRNPATLFAAQHFAMRDHDVVFVTSAPASDLTKFVNIIGTAIYPLVTVKAAGF